MGQRNVQYESLVLGNENDKVNNNSMDNYNHDNHENTNINNNDDDDNDNDDDFTTRKKTQNLPSSMKLNLNFINQKRINDDINNKSTMGSYTSRSSSRNNLEVVYLKLQKQSYDNFKNQMTIKNQKIFKMKTIMLIPEIVVPKESSAQTYINFKLVGETNKSLTEAFDIDYQKDNILKISLIDYKNPYSIDLNFQIHSSSSFYKQKPVGFKLRGNHKSGHILEQETLTLDPIGIKQFDDDFINHHHQHHHHHDNELIGGNAFNFIPIYSKYVNREIQKFFGITNEHHLLGKYFENLKIELNQIREKEGEGGDLEADKKEKNNKIVSVITQKSLTFRETNKNTIQMIDLKELNEEDFIMYFSNYYLLHSKDIIYLTVVNVILPKLNETCTPKNQNLLKEDYIKIIKNQKHYLLVSKIVVVEALKYIDEERKKINDKNFIPDKIVYLNERHSHEFLKSEIILKSTKIPSSSTGINGKEKKMINCYHSMNNIILCTFYIEILKSKFTTTIERNDLVENTEAFVNINPNLNNNSNLNLSSNNNNNNNDSNLTKTQKDLSKDKDTNEYYNLIL